MKFTEATTTDAKRLVRGEHWKLVQTHFRREQKKHHPNIRVITLAGGNPHEEITCIRSLLPQAEIVAVDHDQQCCEEAKKAGANTVICADLFDWDGTKVPRSIQELRPVDVVNLDLCGGITQDVERAVTRYGQLVRAAGVLMLSFSYGRDVAELFSQAPWRGIPAPLAGRVKYLNDRIYHKKYKEDWRSKQDILIPTLGLTSVLAYKGAQMPMCACLWEGHSDPDKPSFVNVTDEDLMQAVLVQLDPLDVSRLYAVPSERIQHFRRKAAARQAVITRQSTSTRVRGEVVNEGESRDGRR